MAPAPTLPLPPVPTADIHLVEPDEQWKADLRRRIEHDLRHMVEDAQNVRDTSLNSQPSESSRECAQRRYEESMNNIRMLAQGEFNRELRVEMSERKWALDMVASNSPEVARHQQWILDNIRKADDDSTPSVHPDSPQKPERVLPANPQKQDDSKRSSDESLEGGYGSARSEDEGGGPVKSMGREERGEAEREREQKEGEVGGDVQHSQPRPPSCPNGSSTQPFPSRSPVSRRDAQSQQQQPTNLQSEEEHDDEGAGGSPAPAHPAQLQEGQPFPSAGLHRRQSSSSQAPVWSRVTRPSEPSGISRTFSHANGQMYSPSPVQFPRRGSVNSTCSNSDGTGLHHAGSLNSDQHRSSSVAPHKPHNDTERPPTRARDRVASDIGPRERQVSTSAGPHDRSSPSIYPTVAPRAIPGARPPPLDDAVSFPKSASSASRTLFSTQRSPEDTRQGIPIPRGPTIPEEGLRGASWSPFHSRRSYGDVNVHRRHDNNSEGDPRLSPVDGGLSDASGDVVGQLDDQQSVHVSRNMQSVGNKEAEQMSIYWEAEARRKEGEATRKEEEATRKEDEARRHEGKARLSLEEAQRLEAHARLAEASVKIREAAVQKREAEINLRELDTKKHEADLHRQEEEFRLKEAEALRKEEEVTRREGNLGKREEEAYRLEKMSQQSLRSAQRLESGAREAETSAKMREAAAQKREAEVNLRELETKKREADLHGREEEFRLKEAEALRKEEEVTRREGNASMKEEEAHRLEEMSHQSLRNAQRLESGVRKAEVSAKMREAAAQKREADAMREEAKVKKREAEVQMREVEVQKREAEVQTREAEAQTREAEALVRETEAQRMEEARHRDGDVCRLEGKARQSLEEAKRLEDSARQAEGSAKIHEAAAQKKEAEAVRMESEAKKLEAEVQYKEAETRRREEEASKKEEEVRLLEERARRSLEEAERLDASIRQAEASSKMREAQSRHGLAPETSHHHDGQPYTSQHQAEPLTNGAKAETRDIEGQLREKERYLRIREAEIQRMLRTADERREAMNLEEDSLRRRLAAMGEQEEKLRRLEATLTESMAIERQRNGVDRDADSVSLTSTIANTPRIRSNVDFASKSITGLKDLENYSNEG